MKSDCCINGLSRVCNLCGQDRYKSLFRPPQSPGPVVQCKGCRFVYVNPVLSNKALIQEGPVLYDRPSRLLESSDISEIQGSWEQPIIEKYTRQQNSKVADAQMNLDHLASLIQKPGKILDIGCFCGVFLSVSAQNGWESYGIEPLVMPAIYARATYGLRVVTDTLHEGLYPSDYFDVVTAFQVFEHLLDPAKEIQLIRQILKPGGLVFIEVPNIEALTVRLLGKRHRHFVQDHVSFFSPKTVRYLVEYNGFRVRKIFYPSRTLSFKSLVWWLGKYYQPMGDSLNRVLPKSLKEKKIRVNVGEIVAIIGEKL